MQLTLSAATGGVVSIGIFPSDSEDAPAVEQLYLGEQISVAMARDLREQAGLTAPMLSAAIDRGVGPEELAAMVFLARRQAAKAAGAAKAPTYAEAEVDVDEWTEQSFTVRIDFDATLPEPEADSPEA